MRDLRPKLLIVEDDMGLQRQLRWAYEGYQLLIAGDREEAFEILREHSPAVVTLDLGLPPDPNGITEGMAALTEILAEAPLTKVVVASGQGDRTSAQRAISLGAWDFYQKPIDIESLGHIVGRAFHVHALEAENRRLVEGAPGEARVLGQIITAAPEMLKVARMIERLASANVTVMLLGGSGTGKELLARGLHEQSERQAATFAAVNCGAIAETLLTCELFGSSEGGTPGKIEQAHGGTLFLDEVSEMPLSVQAQMLRFLRERTIEPVGSRNRIAVDVRVVCATHQNPEDLIAKGLFREDLYHRLAETIVRVPALADRTGDAVLLARYFTSRYASELNAKVKGLSGEALAAIDAWSWPGNVRELENRVKSAVIIAEGRLVTAADLELGNLAGSEAAILSLKAVREAADQQAIRRALARADGNISAAARSLGVSRPTLYDLLKTYNLQPQ
jgi:two-component system NtrC family response regulator